jgi:hypothetical protein
LRDFDSILLYFSEEEIEELQAAIEARASRRLAREEEQDCSGTLEQPVYSPNVLEEVFSEVGACSSEFLQTYLIST